MTKFNKNLHMAYAMALLLTPSLSFAGNYYGVPSDLAARNYMNYEHREPCQYYKVLPSSLAGQDRCITAEEATTVTDGSVVKLLPVVATYTIYFDFDKSNIRGDQLAVLDRLTRELNTYSPSQVTVVGHTDTSGDAEYNRMLSAKRADMVSRALTSRNISSFYLDEHAVGEENLAVPTPDGTRLEENRRVVIQFRR